MLPSPAGGWERGKGPVSRKRPSAAGAGLGPGVADEGRGREGGASPQCVSPAGQESAGRLET